MHSDQELNYLTKSLQHHPSPYIIYELDGSIAWANIAKTLFKEPKHLEIWEFIKITFAEDFVELVDEQIKQSKLYG